MPDSQPAQQLSAIIEREADTLLGILRHYLLRAGLVTSLNADTAAAELLNEVVIEAMTHRERLESVREPVAWLVGIGANLVKRRRDRLIKADRREPLVRDLVREPELSDGEVFDMVARLAARHGSDDPAAVVEAQTYTDWLLAHVSDQDQAILRLAILHELNGEALAARLGISPGAARVRLYRALNRLRTALALDPDWQIETRERIQ